MKRYLLASIAVLFPVVVFAQAAPVLPQAVKDELPQALAQQQPPQSQSPIPQGGGIANCFDFYRFGSVQADITAAVSGTVSGAGISFSGTLKNTNPYPIVDGALYVKVFKKRGGGKDVNGPDVVDQFLVKGDIVIPANGSVPTSFVWKVPAYAESGDYQLATFFTTSRKFNLLGLSFTDDVVGNTVPFKVSGEQSGAVRFEKAGVTVDGQPYRFAAFPPRVSATSSVAISATLRNTTSSDQRVSVSWTIYQWDAQLRENAVQDIPVSSVIVPAGKTVPISIEVKDAKYPVYLAVGTLQWADTRSIVGIRFVRDGLDHTRINFPGVVSYPLKAGQEDTIFSCLHNAGTSASVPGGRLDLTLSDMRGNVIHTYSYTGDVTGAMMGVADRFTPTRDYSSFVLDARLYRGNEFVDEAHLVYDCASLDPASCSTEDVPLPSTSIADAIAQYGIIAIAAACLLVVVVLAVAIHLLRAKPVASPPSGDPMRMRGIIATAFAGALFPLVASAASVLWSSPLPSYAQFSNDNRCVPTMLNPQLSMQYSADAYDASGVPVCGGTVARGSTITIRPHALSSDDIYWFASGYYSDSPYGDPVAGAAAPAKMCSPKNIFAANFQVSMGSWNDIYGTISVNPPASSISGFSPFFTCGSPAADGSVSCTATQAGTANGSIAFATTYGKPYSSYQPVGSCTEGPWTSLNTYGSAVNPYDGTGWHDCSGKGDPTITIPAQTVSCRVTVSDSCSAASAGAASTAAVSDKPFYWLDTAPKVGGYSQNAAVRGDVTQPVDPDTTSLTALMYCRVGRYGAVMNQTQFWVLDKNAAPIFSSDTVACKESTTRYFTSPSGCNTGTCYASTYEIPLPGSGAPYSIHTVGDGANGYAADNYIFDAYLGVTEHKTSVTTAGSSGSSASSCTPPSTPTVAAISTSSCTAGTPFEISFSATDPSGNRVRYGIDWNGDGTIDQLVPPTGYVASGTKLTASRTFSAAGTKSIKVVAINELGISSKAATLPVTCGAASATSVMTGDDDTEGNQDGGAGGTGGSVSPDLSIRATPSLVHPGDVVKVSWSATHVSSCTVTGSNKDTWDTLTSIPGGNDTSPIREATTFLLRCLDAHGTTLAKSATVNILPNWQEQ